MRRTTPSEYLRSALDSIEEFVTVDWLTQKPDANGKLSFPAAVYRAEESNRERSYSGERLVSQGLEFDVRAVTDDVATVLGNGVLKALRTLVPGRLGSVFGPVDAYDDEMKIGRKIWTVEILGNTELTINVR